MSYQMLLSPFGYINIDMESYQVRLTNRGQRCSLPRPMRWREYPINIFYNQQLTGDSTTLVDRVPKEERSAIEAGKEIADRLRQLEPNSIARCIVQLLELFNLKGPKGEDLSRRKVEKVQLVQTPVGNGLRVLKLVVQQGEQEEQDLDNDSPQNAFRMTVKVLLEGVIDLLPQSPIREELWSFYNQFKQITQKSKMDKIREWLQKTELMKSRSIYYWLKKNCFTEKVTPKGSNSWKQIKLDEFSELIGFKINMLDSEKRQEVAEQSARTFNFYYKRRQPNPVPQLVTIESQQKDVIVDNRSRLEEMIAILNLHGASDSMEIKHHPGKQPNTVRFQIRSRYFYGSSPSKQQELLKAMEKLCLWGSILHIQINELLQNIITIEQLRAQISHYEKMIDRRNKRFTSLKEHSYANELLKWSSMKQPPAKNRQETVFRTDNFREYPTNVVYNSDPSFDFEVQIKVPKTQHEAKLASRHMEEKLCSIELASVERCIIQLLYLFSLAKKERSVKGVDFSLRSIQQISIVLVRIQKPCPVVDESTIYKCFQQGEFYQSQQGYYEYALKLIVEQSDIQDCHSEDFNGWKPLQAFHRTLDVLRPLAQLLPEEKIDETNYRAHFKSFFFTVEEITRNARMEDLRQELERRSHLINLNSCYCATKNSCFSEKVASYDTRDKPYLWQQIDESCFESIIGIRIDKVRYPRGNQKILKALGQKIRESSIPIFIFYYSQHPLTEETKLEIIEMEHSDLPIVQATAMDQLMVSFLDNQQSIRRQDKSGRLFSRRNLTSSTRLEEKDLLTIMGRLCLRGNMLRIRMNALLNNQITKQEFTSEMAHYNKMIERKIAKFSTPEVHRYVKELQSFSQR